MDDNKEALGNENNIEGTQPQPPLPAAEAAPKANIREDRFPRRKKKSKKGVDEATPEGTEEDPSVAAAKAGIESIEKVVSINRITKVTKGGKKLSFSALVIVGDGKGKVGYGLEKAAEVSVAIKKSMGAAKKKMLTIALTGTTISHDIIGQCGGARVLLKPAGDGTGVIAAGPVRAVCDAVGIKNILTKCHKSNNPINVVKATLDGLTRLKIKN
ncbi:MAG: 30S ribosomal protein S5 [Candidatus Omnitrophica bacterium]|nr:30S ribosomal protein S5 [Candidatus Omnitrophota bacterium]